MNISGDDEMSERIQAFDWSSTAMGSMTGWPQSLKIALGILLGSRLPMQLLWGPEYIHFYNEAYIPIAADKHPNALGRPGAAIWPELWDLVCPMLDSVVSSGKATLAEDLLLILNRRGFHEECYFTFSYSPVHDEQGAVGGVFVVVNETIGRVLRERRLCAINDLADTLAGTSSDKLATVAATSLGQMAADLPFALGYMLAEDGASLRLTFASPPCAARSPVQLHLTSDMPYSLAEVWESGVPQLVDDLAEVFGPSAALTTNPARPALLLPIVSDQSTVGLLVAGVSRLLSFDTGYREFLERVALHLGSAFARARAHADAQAMIRARDDFLSIAAHELKTPLTPIIGKLQLLQRRLDAGRTERDRYSLHTVIAEAQRLNLMIEDLLDISRLRSGQLTISQSYVDLNELASMIADEVGPTLSAHTLVVEIPDAPVYVNGDALRLAQVLRNLVSNAIKYSPHGGPVTLRVDRTGRLAQFAVNDCGVGVSEDAIPHLFDRYYRVAGGDSSISGMGVGLYVASEITRLHGGTIMIASTPGVGSTFTVALPAAAQAASSR